MAIRKHEGKCCMVLPIWTLSFTTSVPSVAFKIQPCARMKSRPTTTGTSTAATIKSCWIGTLSVPNFNKSFTDPWVLTTPPSAKWSCPLWFSLWTSAIHETLDSTSGWMTLAVEPESTNAMTWKPLNSTGRKRLPVWSVTRSIYNSWDPLSTSAAGTWTTVAASPCFPKPPHWKKQDLQEAVPDHHWHLQKN